MFRICILMLLLVTPARAGMPAGHDDPAFLAAKQAWLHADPDAEAKLDALAANGHAASVILRFRLVVSADPFNGRKIASYPEPEWAEAVRDSELARLLGVLTWLERLDVEPVDVANGLLAHGEPFAAKQIFKHSRMSSALRQFSSNPQATLDAYEAMQALPAKLIAQTSSPINRLSLLIGMDQLVETDTLVKAWEEFCALMSGGDIDLPPGSAMCAALQNGDAARLEALEQALLRRSEQPGFADPTVQEIAGWLADETELPYRALCQSVCPEQMTACAAFSFTRSLQLGGLDGMGSPVETLIEQQEYLASRRAVKELWDMIADIHSHSTYNEEKTAEFFEGDPQQCFARAFEQGGEPWRQ